MAMQQTAHQPEQCGNGLLDDSLLSVGWLLHEMESRNGVYTARLSRPRGAVVVAALLYR